MGIGRFNMLMKRETQIEEEEEEEDFWHKTGVACDLCGETLAYTEEIFLLEVGEAACEEDGSVSWDCVRDEKGDYAYEPYIMQLTCWEQVLGEINELVQDKPPIHCHDEVMKCYVCDSTICTFEPFVAATFGEIHVAKRQPNATAINKIERLAKPKPVCLPCIATVVDESFDAWSDLLDDYTDETEEEDNDEH